MSYDDADWEDLKEAVLTNEFGEWGVIGEEPNAKTVIEIIVRKIIEVETKCDERWG